MHRTHTYTAKLSPAVHARLTAFLEQQRLLYNAALEERISAYRKAGKSLSLYDQNKSLTDLRKDTEFSQYGLKCQRSCLFTLDRAFKSFFRRLKTGQKPGFPRFKSKDRGMRSFSTSQPRLKSHGQWHSLSLKGIGRLRFKGSIPGNVLRACVVKTPLRVRLQLVVARPAPPPNPQPPLGIDVGVAARATLSDGQRYGGHQIDRERLMALQQQLARAKKRSKNRQKRKRLLAQEWQRVRERERGRLHEMTAALVQPKTHCYDVENLTVQNMMGNPHRARSIAEHQWGPFVDLLPDKAARAGGWGRTGDPKQTSQDCRRCGQRVHKTLAARLHVCAACGLSLERDWNAAVNILNRGRMGSPPSGGNIPSGAVH